MCRCVEIRSTNVARPRLVAGYWHGGEDEPSMSPADSRPFVVLMWMAKEDLQRLLRQGTGKEAGGKGRHNSIASPMVNMQEDAGSSSESR